VRKALLAVLALAVATFACHHTPRPTFEARDGRLDLSAWDPVAHGPVALDGIWDFAWRELLPPASAEPGTGTRWKGARVPGPWNGLDVAGVTLGGDGFATYRLDIRLPTGRPDLALSMQEAYSSYRLYANGRLIASAGEVGTSAVTSRPAFAPEIAPIVPGDADRLVLVLQVSNFQYAKGGPWEPLWLGTPEDLQQARETTLMFEAFLVGTMAIMGLYHLSLYAMRRRDRSPLYFGGMCLAMVLRILSTDDRAFVDLIPGMPWAWVVRIEYLSMFLCSALLLLFVRALFPEGIRPGPFQALLAGGVLGLLVVTILSAHTYSRLLPFMQVYLGVASLWGAAVVIRAAWRGQEGARAFTLAFVVLTATVFHDIAASSRLLDTTIFLVPAGIFVFTFLQAVVLSRRFSRSMVRVEEVSEDLARAHAELDLYSKGLELRVAERTHELELANRELARIASVDGLTGIGNRRLFDESLGRAWADHLRRQSSLAVVLCDVDHFKQYNDTYGHLQGDEALKSVARVFREHVHRPLDVVARYGGEELVVLLADTTADGAAHVAEGLRAAVVGLAIAHRNSSCSPVLTVSSGVASAVPSADTTAAQLLARADHVLYRAKQEGRNRVAVDVSGGVGDRQV
jgi:diguanylate cyclase (GGDEF)-like protein